MALNMTSCQPYLYLNNQRFDQLKKVGVIIRIDAIKVFVDNGGDNYSVFKYPPYGRYEEPLNIVDNKINAKSEIYIFYEELLKEKNISIKELNYKLTSYSSKKYYKQPPPYPKEINEPYFPFDLKDLVNHFSRDDEIDAILIVDVRYGLNVDEYLYFVEIVEGTECIISSLIVDLNDKNIIYNGDNSFGHKKIKGKWKTPPDYENLSNAIKSSISNALAVEKAKLNWQSKN